MIPQHLVELAAQLEGHINMQMTPEQFIDACSKIAGLQKVWMQSGHFDTNGFTEHLNINNGVYGYGREINLAYKGTPETDPLRKLLAEVIKAAPVQFAILPQNEPGTRTKIWENEYVSLRWMEYFSGSTMEHAERYDVLFRTAVSGQTMNRQLLSV